MRRMEHLKEENSTHYHKAKSLPLLLPANPTSGSPIPAATPAPDTYVASNPAWATALATNPLKAPGMARLFGWGVKREEERRRRRRAPAEEEGEGGIERCGGREGGKDGRRVKRGKQGVSV